jgi:hypothetical protein
MLRRCLFIACQEATRYKVAGARKPYGGTKGQ